MSELNIINDSVFSFDARGVAKRFRHAAIFGALEALDDGETMRFVNDHDPLPLIGQLQQRYGNQVAVNYVSRDAGQIVIDFTVQLAAQGAAPAATGGSCCSGGGCGG
ncbi:MAG: DUF2249 domain-containing protein [Rhodocyclaceae bacterium]|nr:DUF2249 domain-containing protein [Rhodocyclaceae bacterium]